MRQTKELDVFEDLCEATETVASYHNSKAFARRFAEALACELLDGIVCDATDLYAFARRAALRTLAVVVNPKNRAGCPDGAGRVAAVLASDDYAVADGFFPSAAADRATGGPAGAPPSSLRAFWRAAAADGDAPSILFGLETLAYACAFAKDGGARLAEDAARCLKGAKASFGALVEGLRSGEVDHHGARKAFRRSLDGVADDYVAGLGDAAPCKRVPARDVAVAGAGRVRGASVLFWRRGISFEFAFEDAPEEAQHVDVSYATCLRSVSVSNAREDAGASRDGRATRRRVALGVRERPRGFGRGDAVDVEDDAFIAFAFDANRFAQAKASLSRPAAEYPGAFGAAGRARFLEAKRAASPLKTSRGAACVVAGPPKPPAPIRAAKPPNGGGGGSQRTCQTNLTSPRTAETFLGANPPAAESPELPFLTARTDASPSPAGRFDAGHPESRDAREPSPSPSPSASPETRDGGIARDASPSPRSPSPRSPSPPPPPPSAARTRRRGVKALDPGPDPEPASAPGPEPRRSARLTRSAAAAAGPQPAPSEAGPSRKAASSRPAVLAPAKRVKRKAAKSAADAPPEPVERGAEKDEPNPRAGKTRRVASRFFEPAAAPVKPPAAKRAGRGEKARPKISAFAPTKVTKATKATATATVAEDTAFDAFEAFRLGNENEKARDAFGDGAVSPRVADAARAAEAGFWFSPRADANAGRRAVFARDGAAPKQAARRGRSKSPGLLKTVRAAAPNKKKTVPPSPRASASPPALPSSRRPAEEGAPDPIANRSGAGPTAAASAIAPTDPPAPAAADAPPRASPPTPRAAKKKKGAPRGGGLETPRAAAPASLSLILGRDAPPTNVTVLDASGGDDDDAVGGSGGGGGERLDETVPAAEKVPGAEKGRGRAKGSVAKKPRAVPAASKRAPRTLAMKQRALTPAPAAVDPAPAKTCVAANASNARAPEAEDIPESPRGEKVSPRASESDDVEDAFEKAFDATAEFVAREVEPAARATSETRPATAPVSPSRLPRADEVEQRARRAAASEADAWTAAEVPTLFKLSEKASSREERRKWEIILDVVLARKAGASPDPAPSPASTRAGDSPVAKRRGSPTPDPPEALPGDKTARPAKRRRVDAKARADRADRASPESDSADAPSASEDPANDSNDEMAALEKRLRSMRTTRKERAEMEIAALIKRVREETRAEADAFEAEAKDAREAAAALFAKAEEDDEVRVSRILDELAAAHEAFKDAAREAREALKDAEAARARDREAAAAAAAAAKATLAKRAEQLASRAATRAEATSRAVAKKRKDAATGNSLKSLLLRLAERM